MLRFLYDFGIHHTSLTTGERQCSVFLSDFQRFRRYWTDMLRFLGQFQADFQHKSGWIEPLLVGGYAPFSPLTTQACEYNSGQMPFQNVTKTLFYLTYWHPKIFLLKMQYRKGKNGFLRNFPDISAVFNQIETTFQTINSMDVRAGTLRTYVQAP